jgi:hypothetical protein
MKAQVETCSAQFDKCRRHHSYELVAAVVEQALLDINDGIVPVNSLEESIHRVRWAEDAANWILRRPSRPLLPWSFPWCCEVLGFDCPSIRRGMLVGNKLAKLKEIRRRVNARIARNETIRLADPAYRARQERLAMLAKLTPEEKYALRLKEAREQTAKYRAAKKAKAAKLAKRREDYRTSRLNRNLQKLESLICTMQS